MSPYRLVTVGRICQFLSLSLPGRILNCCGILWPITGEYHKQPAQQATCSSGCDGKIKDEQNNQHGTHDVQPRTSVLDVVHRYLSIGIWAPRSSNYWWLRMATEDKYGWHWNPMMTNAQHCLACATRVPTPISKIATHPARRFTEMRREVQRFWSSECNLNKLVVPYMSHDWQVALPSDLNVHICDRTCNGDDCHKIARRAWSCLYLALPKPKHKPTQILVFGSIGYLFFTRLTPKILVVLR